MKTKQLLRLPWSDARGAGSENSELRCSSTVDLGGLPDGIYFVKVTLASKRTIVKRIVKVER